MDRGVSPGFEPERSRSRSRSPGRAQGQRARRAARARGRAGPSARRSPPPARAASPAPAPRRARHRRPRARDGQHVARAPVPAPRRRCARPSPAKCGGDAGLDREAAQQRLAEGVDGLDAHAARRVEHAGEKPPRAVASVSDRASSPVSFTQLLRQLGMPRTVAQSLKRSLTRFAISAAAALVKVRQRMRHGPRCPRAAAPARGRSAPWSCRCRPRPRPRPRRRGIGRRRWSHAGIGRRSFARPRADEPFLDPRQMGVVGIARRPLRRGTAR